MPISGDSCTDYCDDDSVCKQLIGNGLTIEKKCVPSTR